MSQNEMPDPEATRLNPLSSEELAAIRAQQEAGSAQSAPQQAQPAPEPQPAPQPQPAPEPQPTGQPPVSGAPAGGAGQEWSFDAPVTGWGDDAQQPVTGWGEGEPGGWADEAQPVSGWGDAVPQDGGNSPAGQNPQGFPGGQGQMAPAGSGGGIPKLALIIGGGVLVLLLLVVLLIVLL